MIIDLNVVLAHVSPHGNVQPHFIILNACDMKLLALYVRE